MDNPIKTEQYRKRPVIIDAWQLTPTRLADIAGANMGVLSPNVCVCVGKLEIFKDHARINTLEGVMRADMWDWIITGVNGEIYPCKPDIFTKTYEKV